MTIGTPQKRFTDNGIKIQNTTKINYNYIFSTTLNLIYKDLTYKNNKKIKNKKKKNKLIIKISNYKNQKKTNISQ